MKAIDIPQPGGPDVLRIVDRPRPRPGSGEVLVKVAAAGLNRVDLMQREGKYPPPPGASDIPGLEVAGTVEEVGADSQRWRQHDRVCALVTGGGYAEYCVVPAVQCLPVPEGLDFVAAAALPEACFTVWTNAFDRGRLKTGETFLVHGGSSGIGTTAIQLGRIFGARVFATAGSDEKCAACRRLGAERAVNYRAQDFVSELKAATGNAGVDVIMDMVGGDYLRRNIELLAYDGRLVQIAVRGGPKGELDLLRVQRQRLTITGSTLRARPVEEKGAISRDLEKMVWPAVAAGDLRPEIYATFPFERAVDAHRVMETGQHIGKIVLTIGDGSASR
jgi:putative PIG3 family NAD(P)H quinone oxidoreductase